MAVTPEIVIREFPPVGKYRIRLVKKQGAKLTVPTLDIREYVSSDTFEGFTRRGIRIDLEQANELRKIVDEVCRLTVADIEGGTLETRGHAKKAE